MAGPGNPNSPAWARYYELHPEVQASWAEQNGREPHPEDLKEPKDDTSVT